MRIVYGAFCSWWDSIDKVGKTSPRSPDVSIPCCPHCGSPLYEMPNDTAWFNAIDAFEKQGNSGYRAMVEWGRGKCFRNYSELQKAYRDHVNTSE